MGYPLSFVLTVLFVAYSLVTLMAISLWRKNPSIDINRITNIVNLSLCAALSICAWFYYAPTFVDLDRMMQEIENARVDGISALFAEYQAQPLSFLLLMVGYWTGDRRVLEVIGCVATYGLFMLIIMKLKELLNPDPVTAFLGTLLFLLKPEYVTALTNIRFIVAVELLLFAFLLWIEGRKRKVSILLTVLAVLLHSGVFPLVICMVIANFASLTVFVASCIILGGYSLFLNQITDYLVTSSITPIAMLGSRIAGYYGVGQEQFAYDSQMLAAGYSTLGERYLLLAIPIFGCYFLLKPVLSVVLPGAVEKLIISEYVFTIFSSQSYTVFIRYAYLASLLVIPVIYCCVNGFLLSSSATVPDANPQLSHKAVTQGSLRELALRVLFLVLVFALAYLFLHQWGSTYYNSRILIGS